jgi:soluble lytic murein transglycosylase
MKRIAAVLLTVITTFGGTIPQDQSEKLRRALESNDTDRVIEELQTLRSADEKAFIENNFDYLLGREAESDGRLALALSNYRAVADRDSVLGPYAVMHMSRIARSTGNLSLERIYLDQLLMFWPASLPANGAASRLARSSCESGNYGETIRILTVSRAGNSTTRQAISANDPFRRENQSVLGEAYLRSGDVNSAREIFTDLINKAPNPAQPDDLSLAAAKSLDLLDSGGRNTGKKAPDLPEAESLRRANIYQFNCDFADARVHFESLIANYPNGANAANAVFQIGRGYAQQANYVEALAWYERDLEQYPDSPTAKDALLQAASAYARVGKPKEAIKRYQAFIAKYPADEKLGRAYMNIVDIERDLRNDTEALKWCVKAEEAFKGKTVEAVSAFAEARIYIAKEDWPNALATLDRTRQFTDLGGVTVPGGTYPSEIAFLKGLVLESLKRFPEAIDQYLSIPDGREEYYGWRASERLRSLRKDETAASFIGKRTGELAEGLKAKDPDVRRTHAVAILRLTDSIEVRERALAVLKAAIKMLPKYASTPVFKKDDQITVAGSEKSVDPHVHIVQTLITLGLFDEASVELGAADNGRATNMSYSLANIFKRGGRADRTIAFIEPLWKKVPADYPIELIPRGQLEMLYPTPYSDLLLKYAAERGVDPRLLLAIMRQESRFQADVRSYAAARGLMQFISMTSTAVANELGLDSFRQEDLYYPPTAILFGSQYVADMFKVFPEQPAAVAASYNGGDDNMKRWLSRSRSNAPDRFVPEIVYSQSKDYVYKVMSNYRMYQYLYDQNLTPTGIH